MIAIKLSSSVYKNIANNWIQLKYYNTGKCGGKFEKYTSGEKICRCKVGSLLMKINTAITGGVGGTYAP